ncbi:BLUF domain-containing protein [Paracoccus seriniphilus]|uniref:BLUF domain-containing protein n=1 Tax=Paracoccus seriniphilus TaxID=184748 RepID=UPI003564EF9D
MINDFDAASGLSFFLYRSAARPDIGNGDLTRILSVARSRNKAAGLTGCLHHEDGLFFQWIEGPHAGLRPVIESILRDDRHHDVTVLNEGPLDVRRFEDWQMRFSDRDRKSLMDWFAAQSMSTVDRNEYAGGVVAFLQSIV